ncbi:phospholipase D-like domain-containing protein [Parafrankia sp. BMG5.11]|uniref:phospholipase D-like domain-containing protein n=1 Tax=Parafrankia sp. BMG5.11 TaxID=222540 RepID=UPI00103C1636|nr:phospholipase D-like domain-containing protein [Parafrankia sp. BMG5.11]TCJ33729.1 hypothetical protein E0504_36500 [Parafrankia sp. BMG5.11]
MNDVVIYVPCRIFEVRVTVGAGSSLSPLEQHVLKAVHAGVETVSGLAAVLGTSPRMMVDLLGDLWRAGHVGVDFLDERVSISPEVARLAAADALHTLPGAETADEQRPMMLNALTGGLSPVKGLFRAPDARLELPEHGDEAQLAGIDPAELANAVTKALNEADEVAGAAPAEGRRKRVIRAYLAPASLTMPSSERRYQPIGIRVATNPDGLLVVRMAEESLSRRHQEVAQARLTRLVESQPTSAFVRALESAAGGPPQEPATLASALAALADLADALSSTPPQSRWARHQEIATECGRIVRRLGGLAQQEADVDLLVGQAKHEAAVLQLIRGARTQVVLACPEIDYDGLTTYIEALEEAIRRGVQIVLLRGAGRPEPTAPRPVDNAINALRRGASGTPAAAPLRVLVSPPSSAVIHAKVAIADNRHAIVTSLNFLQPSRTGRHELGVRVAALPDRRNPAIDEMLTWARDTMPDYAVAQAIITDSASFGTPVGAGGDPSSPGAARDVRTGVGTFSENRHRGGRPAPIDGDDPPLTAAASDAPAGDAAAVAWAAAWRGRVEELAAAAFPEHPSVRLIRDGEHRDLLWSALRTARHQLLITSETLAEDVVDQAFVDSLEACLRRGVNVTLIYRRARREEGRRAAQRLAELAEQPAGAAGRLSVREENNHAGVLVADDEAVVTSFSFLAFAGYYGGSGRRRARSEAGVWIRGAEFAWYLLATFGVAAERPAGRNPAAAAERRALSTAQRVLARLTAAEAPTGGAELAELMGPAPDALAVLDALSACGAPLNVVEPAVAAVLGHTDASGPSVDRWWTWLFRRRFEAGDFTVAAALHSLVADPVAPASGTGGDGGTGGALAIRPRRVLVDVAAQRGKPTLATLLGDAVLRDDLTDAEWNVLLAVAVHGLLSTGSHDLADAVAIALPASRQPWTALGTVARRWWEETGQPLPVERVRRGEALRHREAGAAGRWEDLARALAAFDRFSPPFTVGSGTQRFLLRAGGPFSLLAQAARGRDRAAVASWLEDPRLADVGGWVDAATRDAGSTKLIEGHLRPPFVNRVTAIVDVARAVAALDEAGAAAPEIFDDAIDAARDTTASLRAALPRARVALADIELPERALADVALVDLENLIGKAPS